MNYSKTAPRPLRLFVLVIALAALIWFVLSVTLAINAVGSPAPPAHGTAGGVAGGVVTRLSPEAEAGGMPQSPALTRNAAVDRETSTTPLDASARTDAPQANSPDDALAMKGPGTLPSASAAAPTSYAHVVAGGEHSCALTNEGTVRCWGINSFGQLGDGSTSTRSAPVSPARDIGNVVAIAASNRGAMALTADGAVWQWGRASIFRRTTAPEQYTGFSGVPSEITLGSTHYCALIEGEAFCYGNNFQGALGDGSLNLPAAPVRVVGLGEPAMHIAAGANYTCAALQSGYIKCWGANWAGNLGNGKMEASATPVFVRGLSGRAVDVKVNDWFACARLEGGEVECWGGMDTYRTHATSIAGLRTPVDFLSVGHAAACAVSAGAVQCWGENDFGQLGMPASQAVWQAVDVPLGSDAVDVAVGDEHACATLQNGGITCWGSDRRGQLGRSTQIERPLPVAVAPPLAVTQASVGGAYDSPDSFTCAIFGAERGLRCWGTAQTGALGLGREMLSAAQPTNVPGLETEVVQVASGGAHACAITDAGATYCWGDGGRGQLGNGQPGAVYSPQRVNLAGAKAIAVIAGDAYACVLLEAGDVRCWGDIVSGMENGEKTDYSALPVRPEGLWFGVARIFGGGRHACVQMEMGDVRCWGQNQLAQIGNGEKSQSLQEPMVVPLATAPAMLALGDAFTCALMPSHDVTCWGDNHALWMTRGEAPAVVSVPTVVGGLPTQLSAIAAGGNTFCTVDSDGALGCLGANTSGNLGRGFEGVNSTRSAPAVGVPESVASVSVGKSHSCAILNDGALWCWGSDGDGELGIGVDTHAQPPRSILAEPKPTVTLNASSAAPGSFLVAGGFNLAPGQAVDLLMNDVPLAVSTPLVATPAGALAVQLDTTGVLPGTYLLTLAAQGSTAHEPVITSVTLLLTTTAPLLAQQVLGLPIATLGESDALAIAPPATDGATDSAAHGTFRLSIKPNANIRSAPNGNVVGKATTETSLAYDGAVAASIEHPAVVHIQAGVESASLVGQIEGSYTWLPVQFDGATAWVGSVVVLGATRE